MSFSTSDSDTEASSSSFDTDTELERFRRFKPGGTLKRIQNVDSLSIKEIRAKFNIPKSVKITKVKKTTDPVGKDKVVASLYQLYCGLPMSIDTFICALHNAWGITIPQLHPWLCLALKRILSISDTYLRLFIVPVGRQVQGRPWKIFSCEWKNRNSRFRLDGFPKCYREWISNSTNFGNGERNIQTMSLLSQLVSSDFDIIWSSYGQFDMSLSDEYVEWRYNKDKNANEVSLPTDAVLLNRRPGL